MRPTDEPTPEHAEAEMRKLIERADLPEPDEVQYEEAERELHFLWHAQRLAGVLELDGE